MSHSQITRLLHADRLGGVEHGAVHKPLHVAATYAYPNVGELVSVFRGETPGHVYSRQGNPTDAALESKLALLESGRAATVFATGMAAISALMLTLLKAGDHVVSSRYLFGNTNSVLQTLQGLGVSVSLVDATDAAEVEAACTPQTRLVFTETIANPRTQVADLAGIGEVCARRRLLYVVDNTITTPVLLQGREVGAGLVVHSLSKGICGHGNALGGAIVDTGLFDWTGFPNIAEAYRKGDAKGWGMLQIRKKGLRDMGATMRAEDAHRIAMGAETLALRVPRACDNALQLARWFSTRPEIATVHYPGLPSHAQHERASALFKGHYGGLIGIELQEGLDTMAFLDALRLVILSSHLSDNRTLAIPVAQTIYWEMGQAQREAMGITEGLIRVSVGIEDVADLQADFAQALGHLR